MKWRRRQPPQPIDVRSAAAMTGCSMVDGGKAVTVQLLEMLEGAGEFAVCAISITVGILLAFCVAGLVVSSQSSRGR
jgi:hypothetical protein